MRNGWKKDGERRKSIVCRNSETEGRNLLGRTFVAKERITDGTEMRDKYAAEHSK